MISTILYHWEIAFPILFTGIVTTAIGVFGYSANERSITAPYKDEFLSKTNAQVIILVFLFIVGILGSMIQNVIPVIQYNLNPFDELALIILSSRLLLNTIVDEWNYNDTNSQIIYLFCFALVGISTQFFSHGIL